jgi:polar amino acid transport system substrate-binding protein
MRMSISLKSLAARVHAVLPLAFLLCIALNATTTFSKELIIRTIAITPFGFLDSAGKPTGIMYEIGNRIAQEAGLSYQNALTPYARTVLDLEYGNADVILRYNNTELPQIAHQVISVLALPSVVVSKNPSRYLSLADLRGKNVGILRGGNFDAAFAADTAIKKYPVNDYEQALKMIMADHLDAVIGSNIGVYYTAQKLGISPRELSPPLVLSTQHFVLHFSKKTANEQLLKDLKAAVERLQAQDAFTPIINKYMGQYPWRQEK